ncbi:uncharacterized protein LOC128408674 [Podarcis raffonei]|uniref:uncharacterized protein LOC128408674 n=1 Tax=Podarcis raffonei TaxID=65483 RepID=UPI0023297D3E|nr:uncharacterized protein LOC128408674 [Podarcis raffonei]
MAAVLVREGAGGEGNGGARRGGAFSRALLLLRLLLSCPSRLADVSGSTHCPYANVSIAEGSSGMIFANVSSYPNILILIHKSSSSDPDVDILLITGGKLKPYNSSFKEHFYLWGNDLFINNTNKQRAGEYQLQDTLRNCFHRVFLSIPDPGHCPSANLSIPEGASGTIIPNNILNHSNSLALYKKNHSSSSWQYILSTDKGHLNHSVNTYEEQFYISDSGLTIKYAYEGLAGEYQLVHQQNGSCVLQFFLNIPVSGRRHDWAYAAVGLAIFLVLCFTVYLCWKWKRRDTAQLAGGLANGTLPPGSPEVQESSEDPPRRENGNSFSHECDTETNALLP